MNAICPWCGHPQHFSVQFVDMVVPCGQCAREFLLTKGRHDAEPAGGWSPRLLRKFWERFLGLPGSRLE